MKVYKHSPAILLFFFCLFFATRSFSQVPGIDMRNDVREVNETDLNGLPELTVNLDWLATQVNNSGGPKTKFYIGSSTITTEKIKGLPTVSFDNDVLLALIQACKAQRLTKIDFQVATITNQKDIERNLRKHTELKSTQANLLVGKKTILIKVPASVLTGAPADGKLSLFVGQYVYIEIGSICPPPANCS